MHKKANRSKVLEIFYILFSHILSLSLFHREAISPELFQISSEVGVAQLTLVVSTVVSTVVPIGTTIAMIFAGTSAMKEMSKDRREEALMMEAREEKKEETRRMERREEREVLRKEKLEDRFILLFVAVAAIYFIKN